MKTEALYRLGSCHLKPFKEFGVRHLHPDQSTSMETFTTWLSQKGYQGNKPTSSGSWEIHILDQRPSGLQIRSMFPLPSLRKGTQVEATEVEWSKEIKSNEAQWKRATKRRKGGERMWLLGRPLPCRRQTATEYLILAIYNDFFFLYMFFHFPDLKKKKVKFQPIQWNGDIIE